MPHGLGRKMLLRCIAACTTLLVASHANAAGVSEADLIASLPQGGEAAERSARWLGEQESAAGLRAVIATGNKELVSDYYRGFPNDYSLVSEFPFLDEYLRPELEKIVLQHCADKNVGDAVLSLLQERKYRTRELFDALFKVAQSGTEYRLKRAATHHITHTDLKDIEKPLLMLFPSLEDDSKAHYAKFFGQRRHAPALPLLEKWVTDDPRHLVGYSAYGPIAQIGTPQAVAFLIARLDQYRNVEIKPHHGGSLVALIAGIASLPVEVPVPMNQVIQQTPHKMDQNVAPPYIRLLGLRRTDAGIDELLAYMPEPYLRGKAIEALQAYDKPQDWARIRAGLKRLLDEKRINEDNYKGDDRAFRMRVEKPGEYIAQQERNRHQIETGRPQRELEEKYGRKLSALRERDPKKHAEAAAIYKKMSDALLPTGGPEVARQAHRIESAAREHEGTAEHLRFVERKPSDAIREMEASLELEKRLKPAGPPDISKLIWFADTYRFDLKDRPKALEYYRLALSQAEQGKPRWWLEAEMLRAIRFWLPHEISYLETGKTFKGTVDLEQALAVAALSFGLMNGPSFPDFAELITDDNDDSVIHLDRAPQSQLVLDNSISLLATQAEAKTILAFLEQRDPAHFLTAVMLAPHDYPGQGARATEWRAAYYKVISESKGQLPDHSAVLAQAIKQFQRRNGIRFIAYNDTTLSKPELTWRLLRTALHEQDLPTVLSCFTDEVRGDVNSLLSGLTPSNWTEYAKSLLAISASGDAEGSFIISQDTDWYSGRGTATESLPVHFRKDKDRWKIADTAWLEPLRSKAALEKQKKQTQQSP